jgi:hypothetical protein
VGAVVVDDGWVRGVGIRVDLEGVDDLDTLVGNDVDSVIVSGTVEVLVALDDDVVLMGENIGNDSVGTCVGDKVSSAVSVVSTTLALTLDVIVGVVVGDCVMTLSSVAYTPTEYFCRMSRYLMG